MTWVAVAVGGALGSLARYGVSVALASLAPGLVRPYATVVVNLLGCFAIGWLAGGDLSRGAPLSPATRAFLLVGVLGGFTTYSSFALDTLLIARDGDARLAMANVAGQVLLGLGAVWVGLMLTGASREAAH